MAEIVKGINAPVPLNKNPKKERPVSIIVSTVSNDNKVPNPEITNNTFN